MIQGKPTAHRKWELHEWFSLKKGSTKEMWTIKTYSDKVLALLLLPFKPTNMIAQQKMPLFSTT